MSEHIGDRSKPAGAPIRSWPDRLLLICVVLVVGAVAKNMIAAYGPPVGRPVIDCKEPEWDFGEVTGAQAAHTFSLRNSGWKPLVITRIAASCGCLTISPSKFPVTVPAGESLDVSCRINLKKLAGPFKKDLVILSNDPREPQYRLAVVGSARRLDGAEDGIESVSAW